MKNNFNRVSVIAVALMMSACTTVGPNYLSPDNHLPASFSVASDGSEQLANWWKNFVDADLNVLIEQALVQNPDVVVANARLRLARASQAIQDASASPVLEASGRVSKDLLSKDSELFANVPLKSPLIEFTNRQIGFDASWEIDFWGHQQRLSQAALARTQASVERMQDVRVILVAEVARNYIELRAAQQRFKIARDNLHNYDEILRLTNFAFKNGDATQLDVERAQASLDNYQSSLPNFEQLMRQNIVALSNLTTWSVQELDARLSDVHDLMPVPHAPSIGIPSDLLQHRPDVRAAERDLAAASADIGVAISD